jgi:UDP:flavonoid glycosyltransferase YjiC (YdhE family)
MKKILFVSPPFAGHANPLRMLLRVATESGYTCELFTGGPLESELFRVANTAHRVGSNPQRLLSQLNRSTRLLKPLQNLLRRRCEAFRPHLLVADSIAIVAGPIAAEFRVPWITTIATPFAIEQHSGTPCYCGGWRPGHPWRDALARAATRHFKDFGAYLFARRFAAVGIPRRLRADGTEAIYSPQAILGYGLTELEFPRDWPTAFEMIGPVVLDEGPVAPLPRRADKHVIVTLGTHLLWAKAGIVGEMLKLSRQLPRVDFTVSLGGSEGDTGQIAPNLRVLRSISYTRQLSDADLILHHAGAGIAYAALLAGRPSVVVPHDYDHFDYTARLLHHDLALAASSLGSAAPQIEKAFARSWPAVARFQAAARRYQPGRRFLAHVERLIGKADAETSP